MGGSNSELRRADEVFYRHPEGAMVALRQRPHGEHVLDKRTMTYMDLH